MDALKDLLGDSPGMIALRRRLTQVLAAQRSGARPPAILIQGETGTGKGLLAKLLHRTSTRAGAPFVDVNCAAIPETMLEAEMFGFERGAFTDARHSKPGLFQTAHCGCLFLDEVGLLPPSLQAKLLKVLEERVVRRLGGTRTEAVDVWILAATNEDLATAVRERRFREDLYHRLAVLPLWLPPLRDRGNDPLLLAEHLLRRTCADYGIGEKTLGPEARAAIGTYDWPGNIRELANVLERAALLGRGPVVQVDELGLPAQSRRAGESAADPARRSSVTLEDTFREQLKEVLLKTQWNISRTAAILGLTRNTVRSRIKKYGLASPLPGADAVGASPTGDTAAPPTTDIPETPRWTGWQRRHLTILRIESTESAPGGGADMSALELAFEKVRSFRGIVDGITPGSIVAVFGVEGADDGPRQATAAAQAILRAGRDDAERKGPTWRVLVHVAEVVTGRIQGALQVDWREIHRAATALNEQLSHLVPDDLFFTPAARPFFLRMFTLVEHRTPVGPVYRPVRRAGDLHPAPVFVGRHEELAVMRSRLGLCASGVGQVIALVGEPGIGKSRLVQEFLDGSGTANVRGIVVRCMSDLTTIPYFPIRQLVHALCGLEDAAAGDETGPGLASVLASHGVEAPLIPYLVTILEAPVGGAPDASPEATKAGAARALRSLIIGASNSRVHVIVLEDLHWIDQASRDLLAALVEAVSGRPVLLVLTSRSEYEPRWLSGPPITQLALQPLARDECARLLASLHTAGAIPQELAQSIVGRAGGNPFFLEELARVIQEQGALGDAAVPATVHEVLLSRVRRLPADACSVLACGSAIGDDIPFDVLQAATALSEDIVQRSISQLIAGQFLRDVSRATERVYAFKHALTRDVAYGAMTADVRRGLHARLVLAIETFEPARRARWLDRLADHAYRAELWGKAVTYLRAASTSAAGRSAYREAGADLELARTALEHLPRTRETMEQAIDLLFDLRTVYLNLAEHGRSAECINEAQVLAQDLGDGRRLGWASAFRAVQSSFAGISHDRAAGDARHALAIAEDAGDDELLTLATFWLGRIHYTTGQYDVARKLLEQAVTLVAGAPTRPIRGLTFMPGVNFRTWLVWCLGELGEFGRARDAAREAVELADSADKAYDRIMAGFGFGGLLARQGEFTASLAPLERSLHLCDELGIPFLFAPTAARLAFVYAEIGRARDAWVLIERIRAQVPSLAQRFGIGGLQIPWSVWLSQAYLALEAVSEARDLATAALEASVHGQERGHEAWLLQIAGDASLASDPPMLAEGERLYANALTLASDLEMRPLIAHCHARRGMLLRAAGREDVSLQELATARDLFRALRMTTWLARLETGRVGGREPKPSPLTLDIEGRFS